eukprot:maker-scaffold_37-snap-gene-1.45-mRNA-1 protein AED:0.35 eAED:0.41 QI:0/0/0/1/1/1/4/0/658
MCALFNRFRENEGPNIEISEPLEVQKLVSAKLDPNSPTGFKGLPQEYETMLKYGGITKDQVEANPEAAINAVKFHMEGSAPPPPPSNQAQMSIRALISVKRITQGLRTDPNGEKVTTMRNLAKLLDLTKQELPTQEQVEEELKEALILKEENPYKKYKKVGDILGMGASGAVYKCKSNETGGEYAMKITSKDELELIKNEIAVQTLAKIHPNIVALVESFVWKKELVLIIELMTGGALTSIVSELPKFNKDVWKDSFISYVMYCMLRGLAYIHAQFRLHRDIKSDNVLLGADGAIKLGDFGFVASLTVGQTGRTSVVGTPYWMAPEVIGRQEYDGKVDVWSTAITAFECTDGFPPYMQQVIRDGEPPLRVLYWIQEKKAPVLEKPELWDPKLDHFLKKALVKDPAKRSSSEQLLMHPYMGLRCSQEEFAKFLAEVALLKNPNKPPPQMPKSPIPQEGFVGSPKPKTNLSPVKFFGKLLSPGTKKKLPPPVAPQAPPPVPNAAPPVPNGAPTGPPLIPFGNGSGTTPPPVPNGVPTGPPPIPIPKPSDGNPKGQITTRAPPKLDLPKRAPKEKAETVNIESPKRKSKHRSKPKSPKKGNVKSPKRKQKLKKSEVSEGESPKSKSSLRRRKSKHGKDRKSWIRTSLNLKKRRKKKIKKKT